MKVINHQTRIILSTKKLKYILSITAFLFCFFAKAQVKPSSVNMTEFKKSPNYAKRKAQYDKNTSKYDLPKRTYQSGPGLNIHLDKTPIGPVGVKTKVNKTTKSSGGGYDCTTTEVNLTANSTDFLNNDYSGSTANIYPGVCYTYAHLTDGSWQEQKGDRYPIIISTDNPNTSVPYVQVQTVDKPHVEAAIAKLFKGFSNVNGNESTVYQVEENENAASYNLAIGAGASGYGVDVSNQYSTGNQSSHVHLTIDATKTFFTISTSIPDSGVYKNSSIDNTPYLSMIGEVNYGVRILANADVQFSSQQEADHFKASYSGFGFNANLNIDYGTSNKNVTTTINAYIIGGPGGTVVATSLEDLQKQINFIFSKANYQNARPIKYKVYSMAGDIINTYSETDNFTIRSCTPSDGGSPEIESILISYNQGGDGKELSTQFLARVYSGISTLPQGEPMFVYDSRASGTKRFENNSTGQFIVLTPNKNYKGKFDVSTFIKNGGGTIYMALYVPQAWDIWQIIGATVTFNIKHTTANPSGTGGPLPVKFLFQGANQLNLEVHDNNLTKYFSTFSFGGDFKPIQ